MIESLTQYWYLYVVLVALIVLTVFVGKKASKAAKKRNEEVRKYEETMQRYKFLKEKYSDISKDDAENAPSDELCEGVTALIQIKLEKAENPDEEFKLLHQWEREVYSLYYFAEDCKTSLSFFFKNNAQPLPENALSGLMTVGESRLYALAAAMNAMYDDNNESVSLDMNRVNELDEKFKSVFDKNQYFDNIKTYIINKM